MTFQGHVMKEGTEIKMPERSKSKDCVVMKEPKLLMELESRGNGPLEQRTVTVCSGLDLVNITYNNFVAADEKTAAV